jgi:RHS repeat-associated protein
VVTNWRGQIHERLEYTPYGELWIDWKGGTALEDTTPFRFTGKEMDAETGFYYYGARYLDPKTSRWVSADPALGEYVPTPGQEAGKLPGMGGVFNTVNLHVYHYAGNNPVKYVDPDGNENKAALAWMKTNLTGIPPDFWYFNSDGSRAREFKSGEIPKSLFCYQAVYCAYGNADAGMEKKLPPARWWGKEWFKEGGTFKLGDKTIGKKFERDITKGEVGDIVFMGDDGNMNGHAVLFESMNIVSDSIIEINTYGAYSDDGNIGSEKMTFKKDDKGKWINTSHGGNYEFRGYGQLNKGE